MRLTPLHSLFGVEVREVDLRAVRRDSGYREIRAAFEEHSLLLFRGQALDDAAHLALGALFGPIEDRSSGRNGPEPRMDNVTNRLPSGAIAPADSAHTLNLTANQLWHTDSTFLPVPALANILAAVEGLGEAAGQALVDELMAFVTRPACVYTHRWQPGDVLIWDERATVHRGRPWPYEQERTLASICVSVRYEDGLAEMRPD